MPKQRKDKFSTNDIRSKSGHGLLRELLWHLTGFKAVSMNNEYMTAEWWEYAIPEVIDGVTHGDGKNATTAT